MPRAMWEGAVSFGLIVIPVKLYGATEPVDVPLHQVHGVDGGRISTRSSMRISRLAVCTAFAASATSL